MTTLLRPAEAAAILSVSLRTLQRLRQSGLTAYRIRGSTRYVAADIESLIQKGRLDTVPQNTNAPTRALQSQPKAKVADFEHIRTTAQKAKAKP